MGGVTDDDKKRKVRQLVDSIERLSYLRAWDAVYDHAGEDESDPSEEREARSLVERLLMELLS